jgi:hypothetical protein
MGVLLNLIYLPFNAANGPDANFTNPLPDVSFPANFPSFMIIDPTPSVSRATAISHLLRFCFCRSTSTHLGLLCLDLHQLVRPKLGERGALHQITRTDYERLFDTNDVALARLRNFARSHDARRVSPTMPYCFDGSFERPRPSPINRRDRRLERVAPQNPLRKRHKFSKQAINGKIGLDEEATMLALLLGFMSARLFGFRPMTCICKGWPRYATAKA